VRIPVHGFRIADTRVEEIEPRTIEEVVGHIKSPEFVWLDLDLQSAPVDQVKDLLLNRLDVHPLVVEECITPDVYQPKFDEESGYKFFIFHYFREGRQDYLKASELNIYMGENFVMTLHRSPIPTYLKLFAQNLPSDLFVFKDKAVIFLYHILDVLIDDQLKTLQLIQKRGDELEFSLLNPASGVPPPVQGKRRLLKRRGKAQLELFKEILAQRHNLSLMRKSLLQELEILQEQVKNYEEPDEPLAITDEEREEVVVYLGGLVNHLEQAIQIVDQEREILSQLMDMHSTIIQARSEEIQRILTVYAALFIPLTFVASYFGMNLNVLHGVDERYFIWGLDVFLLLMSAGIIYYFYRKDWL
jgi:magnesium transporter